MSREAWATKKSSYVILVLTVCGIEPTAAQGPSPMSTAELFELCTSTLGDERAICDGYMDGAVLFANGAICQLDSPDGQLYCSGLLDSQQLEDAANATCIETCTGRQTAEASRLCQASCNLNRIVASERCFPDEDRAASYCLAFNLNNEALEAMYTPEEDRSARQRGLFEAYGDQMMLIFAVFAKGGGVTTGFAYRDCLESPINAEDIRSAFLEFVEQNPSSLMPKTLYFDIDSAIVAIDRALSARACAGSER